MIGFFKDLFLEGRSNMTALHTCLGPFLGDMTLSSHAYAGLITGFELWQGDDLVIFQSR